MESVDKVVVKKIKYNLKDSDARKELDSKQDAVDSSLQTESKNIVGAINEINSNLKNSVDGIYNEIVAQGTIPKSKDYKDVKESINTLAEDKYEKGKADVDIKKITEATATSNDIKYGQTAWVNGDKLTGAMSLFDAPVDFSKGWNICTSSNGTMNILMLDVTSNTGVVAKYGSISTRDIINTFKFKNVYIALSSASIYSNDFSDVSILYSTNLSDWTNSGLQNKHNVFYHDEDMILSADNTTGIIYKTNDGINWETLGTAPYAGAYIGYSNSLKRLVYCKYDESFDKDGSKYLNSYYSDDFGYNWNSVKIEQISEGKAAEHVQSQYISNLTYVSTKTFKGFIAIPTHYAYATSSKNAYHRYLWQGIITSKDGINWSDAKQIIFNEGTYSSSTDANNNGIQNWRYTRILTNGTYIVVAGNDVGNWRSSSLVPSWSGSDDGVDGKVSAFRTETVAGEYFFCINNTSVNPTIYFSKDFRTWYGIENPSKINFRSAILHPNSLQISYT